MWPLQKEQVRFPARSPVYRTKEQPARWLAVLRSILPLRAEAPRQRKG
jgi:hypothetical protein